MEAATGRKSAGDPLSRTFSALADPTRRSILERLAQGPATVGELAQPFAMSLPSVSRHLKVLEEAGLVSKSVNAQWRQCRIEPAHIHQADQWLAALQEHFDPKFARLDEYLRTMMASRKENPDD